MLSEQDQIHRLYSTFLLAPSDIQFTVEVINKKMDTLFDKQISKLYLGNKDQELKEKTGETRFPFPYDFYCIQKYLLFTKFIIIIIPHTGGKSRMVV